MLFYFFQVIYARQLPIYNMSKFFHTTLFLGLTFFFGLFTTTNTRSFTIYRIGEVVTGHEYDSQWQQWFKKNLTVWIGDNLRKDTIIFLRINTRLGDVTISLDATTENKEVLKQALAKSVEWAGIAKRAKADTTRSLGCFGKNINNSCKQTGIANTKGQMGLRFFSTNKAGQVNLIINAIDKDNSNIRGTIYFSVAEVRKFLSAMEKLKSGVPFQTEPKLEQDPDNLFK